MAASNQLSDLIGAAVAFVQAALDGLPATLANRLAVSGGLHVVIAVAPMPRARLVAVAPGGEMRCVHSGAVPPVLGAAAAAVLGGGLAQLSGAARTAVARLQAAGQAPGVIVAPTGEVHITVDTGSALPQIVATLQVDLGRPQ